MKPLMEIHSKCLHSDVVSVCHDRHLMAITIDRCWRATLPLANSGVV